MRTEKPLIIMSIEISPGYSDDIKVFEDHQP